MTFPTLVKILAVMFLWAICFPLITTGIDFAPHLTFATLRALLAGVSLTCLAFALRRPLPQDRRTWIILIVIGVTATSMGFFGMFHAAEFVAPGLATVIASTQPLLTAVFAGFFLNERLSRSGKVGLILGFLGILVISAPQLFGANQENYMLGVFYIILAAVGITISNILMKHLACEVDALMAMGLQILFGSIPLGVLAVTLEDTTDIQWTFPFVSSLLTLSFLGTALAYWLWFSALEKTPLSQANAFSFLVPVLGLTLGFIYYGESLSGLQIIGISLSIFGVALVTRNGASTNPSEDKVS